MFGAFGLLAIGLVYLSLRYMAGERVAWGDTLGVWGFWLYNLGVVLWVVLNFFPIGWRQLEAVYEHGFAYARSLDFYNTTLSGNGSGFPVRHLCRRGVLMTMTLQEKCVQCCVDRCAQERPCLDPSQRQGMMRAPHGEGGS